MDTHINASLEMETGSAHLIVNHAAATIQRGSRWCRDDNDHADDVDGVETPLSWQWHKYQRLQGTIGAR